MNRHPIIPRPDWKSKVEALGFSYHSPEEKTYWDESAFYSFNYDQINLLENTSNKLHRLCLKAVDHVIRENLFAQFSIPENYIPLIRESWTRETPSIYGRFDLSWNGDLSSPPRMLEYNADTPTSLLEAAVIQWFWLKEIHPREDQFNSIHEKLIAWWKEIKIWLEKDSLYFSCLDEFPEDFMNMSYLQDCASQAGIPTQFIPVHEIGWNGTCFTDLEEDKIQAMFKLYPWEWIMHEEFGAMLPKANTVWIEPPWKMILSNKAILPVLWKLFPGHPNLLECYFENPGDMQTYIKKPVLSREGANVTLVENGKITLETGGEYGEEGFVYQQLHKLPEFNGNFPVIGSWIIGGKAAGIGIREGNSPITDNFSRFVPHCIIKS
jgi:glutathionylspermidine synthase